MARYNYTGLAKIKWKDGSITEQFIDYAGDTGTLRVWPDTEDTYKDSEYIGHMRNHPAIEIRFLHWS